MLRIFSLLTLMAVLLLLSASSGIFWIASTATSQAKQEALGALAKGAGLSISAQIELLNLTLDKMAQDAETVQAATSQDPVLIRAAEARLVSHLPHAFNIRLLLPGVTERDDQHSPPMTYADLNMVRESFATDKNPLPAVQGDTQANRHLAIARKIVRDERTVGVLLASFDEDFIEAPVSRLQVGEGYILLRQAKMQLGAAGHVPATASDENPHFPIGNTPWEFSYGLTSSSLNADAAMMLGFVSIPLVLLAGGFLFGYRKLSALLREDLGSAMKAFKDMMRSNFQGDYPTRLAEMNGFISTLIQYKRVLDRGETGSSASEALGADSGFSDFSSDFSDFGLAPVIPAKTVSSPPRSHSGEVFKKPVKHIPPETLEPPPTAKAAAVKLSKQETEHPGKSSDPKNAIFRAYDIRGIAGTILSPEIVYDIGRALGTEAAAHGCKTIVMGRDGRTSSPKLSAALADGIITTGCGILDIGVVPTPVLYFVAHHAEGRSGAMITGSHNPPDYNGIKMVIKGETLAEERILNLKKCIDNRAFRTDEPGKIEKSERFNNEYIGTVCEDVHLNRPMKVVVDCGNGAAGEIAPKLLRTMGCEVVELFCEIDGTFPNHHPDPSRPENLRDLIMAVKHCSADVGLAFDGDGDRLGVVDAGGNIIWPDRQMMLYAQNVLAARPGAEIIFDAKCSRHLPRYIKKHGGRPLMWKTGHSLMKAKLQETGAELAGEMSGHLFFNDRWFGFDDALYAAARLIEILSQDTRTSTEVFGALPDSVNTPELNVDLAEGENFGLIDAVLQAAKFPDAEISTVDGLRVDFPDGFGLVRASNTTPSLAVRFEADSHEALKRIQNQFRQLLENVKPGIKLPF